MNLQTDRNSAFFIPGGIIIILSSLISPLFLGEMLREIFYKPENTFIFVSSPMTYIVFASSIALIGVGMLLIPIHSIKKWIPAVVILAAFAGAYVSIDEYHYGTADGFYYNGLLTLDEKEIKWADVEKMEQVYVKKRGTQVPKKLIFNLKDGEQVSFDFDRRLYDSRRQIDAMVTSAGGESVIEVLDSLKDLK
ncbi:hypothetical protein [Falsibacillus pallidus]|uniref:PH (Pleckstrin Homology) domain-containing protein n=1 Tax=Falsibacillus pallidus TaxID=493781 RepID=A0A370GQ58_9BACI|nr:hypothetical protein [Falsibacillus pallidus]RDI45386.1 hypothetical protein DFR59_1029 [Falsibacillus pallidus]